MARVTTLHWTAGFITYLETLRERDGLAWTAIGERYGTTGAHMRGRYYQAKRALQPTRGHAGDCASHILAAADTSVS